jgi:hypothetical protein
MNRKSIYSLIAGTLVLAGLSSCNNDKFLEVTHYSILPQESAYESDENALASLTGCYDLMLPSGTAGHNADPYKPYVFTTSHPSMDSQASGWDAAFCRQGWNAQTTELNDGWRHAYAAIARCNDFLAGLETAEGLSDAVKKTCEGEARALRGYQYQWLATTFGRVPMLSTGENYSNTPTKERAQTFEEMWDFIIEDFKAAADLLDWKPYNGQYGRCTKGMALAYLGDAYMWKSYRTGNDYYNDAKTAFKQILDKKDVYELNPSFTTLFDADEAWGKEAIWQVVLNEGDQWGSWDASKMSEAHGWTGFYYAAPSNGAWGTYACSYELYDAYEPGDKRRDGSLVTACIPESELDRISKEEGRDIKNRWKQSFTPDAWIANPNNAKYLGTPIAKQEGNAVYDPNCPIGFNPFAQEFVGYGTFHRVPSDIQPTVYSTKHWRNGRGTHRWNDQWLPDHIYMKRLANVMLDYAECCFRTGDAASGWAQINQLRQRAWGINEDGKEADLAKKYNKYYINLKSWLGTPGDDGFGDYTLPDNTDTWYPIPFGSNGNTPEDAETYYTKLKAEKGFSSDVWKVAVNEERRKELNAEWSLTPDLIKSGYIADHIEHNYPKGYGYENGEAQLSVWRTYRSFDFDIRKMDMPIPQDELIKNPACDQNEAYR